MNTYTLEKYRSIKSRHTCPACGYKHEFARYIDAEGNYLADHVGRCNRESKCGYHLKPRDFFLDNPTETRSFRPLPRVPKKPVQYVHPDNLFATLASYEKNTFVRYLHSLFIPDDVQILIDYFGLGTTKNGSCIFWQVDTKGQVRTGKAILYGVDGHRDKSVKPYFIHSKLGLENIEQCLFGLHQLMIEPHTTIALVESEKTAVLMTAMMPTYHWMATGGKQNLSKAAVLKGHRVVAFPDSDAFDEWNYKLTPMGFKVSKALQQHLTPAERMNGYDLADLTVDYKSNNYQQI